MGATTSCGKGTSEDMLLAIGEGDLQLVKLLLLRKPKLMDRALFLRSKRRSSVFSLHHAASLGQSDVLSLLLENGAKVDTLNHRKQTSLMLACKNGRVDCVERLIEWGANVLIFDAVQERACIHYAARNGHLQCLQIILNAARSSSVAQTWGFTRFVNVRDCSGASPLHLAAGSCQPAVVRLLLSNGALVCATTTSTGKSSLALGSTPLHFAARGGSTECIKELLAWGADRLQRNSEGHTPFHIARKHRNMVCAALLNPSTAEPLVWPSPWKFMSDLDPEARILLEAALLQANDAWEKRVISSSGIYETVSDAPSRQDDDGGEVDDVNDTNELCCICFERACTIEVQDCGHQMCASCTLALCCYNKPNPVGQSSPAPACPFCRQNIEQLKLARPKEMGQREGGREEERQQADDGGRDEGKISTINRSKKAVESGSNNGFIGLVSKGSFRLLSSAKASNRVVDAEWQKESSSTQDICVPRGVAALEI